MFRHSGERPLSGRHFEPAPTPQDTAEQKPTVVALFVRLVLRGDSDPGGIRRARGLVGIDGGSLELATVVVLLTIALDHGRWPWRR